ncbi:hypothetical protein [uncultured Lactobacillus sp.]|uniref:hypothetical protein n=1 Tax=uncultured Lactobacillus sp. TaxID=153152 RepID=UPI00260E2F4B|nr:hypothetical protein [uncultured Lactobacillus sp.]
MKVINIILTLIVLIATISLVLVAINGNAVFGATGLALIYFAGSAWYFIQSYTLKKRS